MIQISRIPPTYTHFAATCFLGVFIVYLQTYLFARLHNPWFHVDLVTIYVVYISIEHFLIGAFFKIMTVAVLLQTMSAAPDGFFIMYYLMVIVSANVLSRHLVFHNLLSQFLSFLTIFVLKFVLLYYAFYADDKVLPLDGFVSNVFPGLIVTSLLCVPAFNAFSQFDSLFEIVTARDRKQEIFDSL